MRTLKSLAVVLLFAAPAFAGERYELKHLGKLVRVSDPQLAPDGKSIAVVVSRPNYAENRYDAQLLLVDVASQGQRVLAERRGVAQPRWSPSGDRLAFLATVDGKPQLLVLPMNGGEAQQLTESPTGLQQYAWSPDGSQVAYAAADEPAKKEGEERFNDSFEVTNDDMFVVAPPMPTHLWLIPSSGGTARRLTSGAWSLPVTKPPGSPASPIAWSPDGKSIAIVKVASPHSGDSNQRSIQILDVASAAMKPLTGKPGEAYPTFSPDGTKVVYWSPRDGTPRNVNDVHLVSLADRESTNVTRAIDRNIARSIFLPDGKSLLVGANDGTTVSLWVQPLGGQARKLALDKVTPASSFWVDVSVAGTGAIAFSGSEPRRPAELYYLSSPTAPVKRLTDFNKDIAALDLGRTETIEWPGPDGFKNDGVLTFPPDFTQGRKYPLVLYVHGGPTSASKEAFSSRAQLLASQGWIVFEPNYRGSDNLGNAFKTAIWNDAGAGPGRDVMSGVELLKKKGYVDESRLAVSGWSYGGYMTTWLLGHYPEVWRAAVAGAAVTDWMDQYNLGDGNVRVGNSFGGSPWKDDRMKAFWEQSPMSAAHRIKAPTLVLSNTGDYRVPITQSFKLYHALKDNGVKTQFIAYPMGGHNAADPVRARDVDRRWIAWLSEHLNSGTTVATPEGNGQK